MSVTGGKLTLRNLGTGRLCHLRTMLSELPVRHQRAEFATLTIELYFKL